jgi:hypothetical protein
MSHIGFDTACTCISYEQEETKCLAVEAETKLKMDTNCPDLFLGIISTDPEKLNQLIFINIKNGEHKNSSKQFFMKKP